MLLIKEKYTDENIQNLSLAVSYKCMVLKKESGNNLPEPFYIF